MAEIKYLHHEEPVGSAVSDRKKEANHHTVDNFSRRRRSSHSATKHGQLAKKVLFDANGQPRNPELQDFSEQLREEFPGDNIAAMIIRDITLMDYGRLARAVEVEERCAANGLLVLDSNCQRYANSSRKALLEDLKHLKTLSASRNSDNIEEPQPAAVLHGDTDTAAAEKDALLEVAEECGGQQEDGRDSYDYLEDKAELRRWMLEDTLLALPCKPDFLVNDSVEQLCQPGEAVDTVLGEAGDHGCIGLTSGEERAPSD